MKRSGVSPVVSSLLVTVIIIVVGISVFYWAMNVLNISGENIFNSVAYSSEKLREDFIIEHVIFYYQNNSITVYIRNVGDIEVKITDLYLMDLNTTDSLENVQIPNGGIIVLVGELNHFNVRVSTQLRRGDVYYIKIVSGRGNSYIARVRAT